MEKEYEYLPDGAEVYSSYYWWYRPPTIIESPPQIHFNPFYYNYPVFTNQNIVVRILPPPID